jgi:hypothetical protein
MVVGFHGKRFEAALVQMAAADILIMGVPALGVGQREPVHEIGKLAVMLGPQNHVPVIGHQAIGEQPCVRQACLRFHQHIDERLVIAVLMKKLQLAVAPVENVIDVAAQGVSSWSAHDPRG